MSQWEVVEVIKKYFKGRWVSSKEVHEKLNNKSRNTIVKNLFKAWRNGWLERKLVRGRHWYYVYKLPSRKIKRRRI